MTLIIIGVAAAILLLLLLFGYVKAPPDQAYIISGLRRKFVIGRASIRIPFLERLDKLSLKMISVDVKTSSPVPTAEFINIMVDSAVKIKIGSDMALLTIAAENFLNRDEAYIVSAVQDVLEGNMREIVGQMRLEDMVSDRKLFAEKVQENAGPDMARMGLQIVSFNVQNFIDRNGVIEDLGIDNITQIKKTAAIAKAEGERDILVAQAKADQESNDSRINADLEIARRKTDLAIKEAELKTSSDVKQAEADAAYRIQEEAQRRSIEIASVNADIARREREVELRSKEAEVAERALEAEVIKKADAEKYARQMQAEAELYEQQKEAEGIRARGLAEAEAIRAKALAEAEGIEKKAEAMTKMGEAAVLEMYFEALPEVMKNAATPLANVDSITMYGEGNSAKLVRDIVNTTTQVSEGVKEATGVDLKSLLAGFLTGKALEKDNTTVINVSEAPAETEPEEKEETKE
ncbi:MAG: flotillin family protein [Christensenellaceae bacterium]|jgi:flotillin